MKYLFISLFAILLTDPLVSQARPVITITGSSTIQPVMRELADRYYKSTGVEVNVSGGGSGKGLSDVISGKADIGMVSRRLDPTESSLVSPYLIGYDGVAVITHATNPVTSIDKEQIRAIYEGRVRNWVKLGGPDRPIEVLAKARNRATRAIFDDFFRPATIVPSAELVGSNAEMIVMTSILPGAIGYVSIGALEKALAHGVLIKALPLETIQPIHKHVKDHSYKLTRLLNVVTSKQPVAPVKKFIDYVCSSHGREVILKYNYVAVN